MKFQHKRFLSQLFFFFYANLGILNIKTGLCFPFFYCHACPTASSACPIRAVEQSVYKQSFAWKFLLYPLLILGLVGTLFGRAVCGWACPIGFLQRCTAPAARKVRKKPFAQKLGQHKIQRYLRYVKYGNLVGLAVVTSYLFGVMFTDICPIGFLTGTIPVLALNPGQYVPSSFFMIALIIFILFIVLIFTVEQGWCRYFCPVGAILAPFNKISFLTVKVNKDECIHCNACSNICPMGIDVPAMDRDPECTLCGKCITACPKKIISYERIAWKK